jgi:hypothetical protein
MKSSIPPNLRKSSQSKRPRQLAQNDQLLSADDRILHLYTPQPAAYFNLGVFYKLLMLFVGFFALILPSTICAWISLTFCMLSVLNQPLPLSWRYAISNIPFPVMLIFLAYNINEHNNPIHQWLGWTKG